MPRSVQQLRVFVASPADVQPERARLEKVVRELNLSWPKESSVQLDLLRWETHSYPNFGKDAQAVINEQIGTDYDIFIGILWSRLGTPTLAFPSGTIEEFHAAFKRWQADPQSVTLMLYFKEEPVSPSHLDTNQLAYIQGFKRELPDAGGLYWTFGDADDFETNVRLHLLRAVQDLYARKGAIRQPAGSTTAEHMDDGGSEVLEAHPIELTEDDDSDLGFLDYMELVEEATTRHTSVVERMIAAIEQVGQRTRERTMETQALTAQPNVVAARRVFDESARDLNEFSAALLSEIPQMSQAHGDLLKYVAGGASILLDFGAYGKEQALQLLTQLDNFAEVITSTRGQMEEFRSTIANLPRMMVTFNRAKRRAVATLATLDAAYANALIRSNRVRENIVELLNRAEAIKTSVFASSGTAHKIDPAFDRITSDPNVMDGKPCIRGMRVTVGMIVGLLTTGRTHQEVLQAYPYLEAEDIRQAVEFASWSSEGQQLPQSM